MAAAKRNYTRMVPLLKSRGFIDTVQVIRNSKQYHLADYGPPGTLLRQNVWKQWWKLMVCRQSSVFPVERPLFNSLPQVNSISAEKDQSQNDGEISCRETLQQACFAKYLQVLKLTNTRLPFSIASIGPCVSWRQFNTDEPEEKSLLLGHSGHTKLLLQNYTPPTGTSSVFDYWLQLRLSWWKKYSRNPANFSVTSNSNNSSNGSSNSVKEKSQYLSQSSMSIQYRFPWGPETVEEVRNLGDTHLASLQESTGQNCKGKTPGNKTCLPHCIECDTSIEMAMAAWLVDSYHERQPVSDTKKKDKSRTSLTLQLHPQIAPYQVAIVVSPLVSSTSSSASSSSSTEMRYICGQLETDLQKADVSVFNTSEHGSTVEAHFNRNDQLGIPYTVVVNETTLSDGLINTRNRDTHVMVPSHISTLTETLSRSLTAQLE